MINWSQSVPPYDVDGEDNKCGHALAYTIWSRQTANTEAVYSELSAFEGVVSSSIRTWQRFNSKRISKVEFFDAVVNRAGVSYPERMTATKMRHRASTYYSLLDVPENERKAFYTHMWHSREINETVYLCPTSVVEITKVGRYLEDLDNRSEINSHFVRQITSKYSLSKT